MTWNPDQYHLFREARTAPARDLQGMIPEQPYQDIVDLGCGTGEQTWQLAERFPAAQVVGLDSSPEMLAKTQLHAAPNLRFQQGNIAELAGEYDLIYSNAALQWLPDHRSLLSQICNHLRPGGVLAVQVPANHDHATHVLLSETAQEFGRELGEFTRFGTAQGVSPVLTPAQYAELLDGLGLSNVTTLSKVYPVVVAGAQGLVEWTKGTALVPYLSQLDEATGKRFLDVYLRKLTAAFPGERVYYAFTRVLFTAQR